MRTSSRNLATMEARTSPNGLHVYLFGRPRFELGGVPVELRAPPRTLPLLASMLLDGVPSADARARTAARIWPDVPRDEARKNLRRHLSYLRKALADLGLGDHDLSDLHVPQAAVAWTDVSAFDRLSMSPADAATAMELYTAPLLESFDDDEWLVPHRTRFQRDYIDLVMRLIDRDWIDGRTAVAFARAERALTIEPFAEEFVQAALRLAVDADDGGAGLALFDRFAARLRAEFDLEPGSQTRALVERLRLRTVVSPVPAAMDSFVGRRNEVERLGELTHTHACVGLYGPSGIGKTRLAAAIATREGHRFADGVWWIDLARRDARTPVEAHVLRSINSRRIEGGLADSVAGRNALFVFDECENALDEVAAVVRDIMRASGAARVLVTSIRRLPLPGAVEWGVEPLRSADAVDLFIDRAAAAMPRTAFGAIERDLVASICATLDGIPLAIELAARNTRSRSLTDVLREASASVDEVVRGALERTAGFLSEDERAGFLAAAVFVGEIRAHALAATRSISEASARTLLEALADSQLVVFSGLEGVAQYEMLQTVRVYALATLSASERTLLEERHDRYFADLVFSREAELRGRRSFAAYGPIEDQYASILSALDRSLASDTTLERAGRMCLALSRFWYDRGYVGDGVRSTQTALALLRSRSAAGDATLLEAELRWILAWLRRNEADSLAAYAEAVGAYDDLQTAGASPHRLASANVLVSNAARMIGNYDEAMRRSLAAVTFFSEAGDRYFTGYAHLSSGTIDLSAGRIDAAREHLVEALAAYEDAGAEADAALAMLNLVECAYAAGNLELAEMLAREAAERCSNVGNAYYLAYANHSLARVLCARDERSACVRVAMAVTRSAREFGDRELVALCAETGATIASRAGRFTNAAMLIGAADAERARASAPRPKIYEGEHERLRTLLRGRIGDEAERHAERIGAALSARDLPGRIEASLRDAMQQRRG